MFVSQVEEAIPGISATDVDTRKDKHFVKWLKSQMVSRRKPAAPTYAQLFGDGSGTSSSGPSSSDAVPDSQTSQRVFFSPPLPPQMPPPPPPAAAPQPVPEDAVHPDLCVPSYAPFARYTVEDLLAQTRREGLDVLDPDRPRGTYWFGANNRFEKRGVLPSLSELFKMTHATSKGVFVDPASEKLFQAVAARIEERLTQLTQESPDGLPVTLSPEDADRIFEEVAPKKKGRIVGIGSVNEVTRATSSYTSRRDEETSQMKARMDSQQVRLDSLEDFPDVMAVGNPVMQRMLSERRAALGLPVRDPQESDPTRQQPSNPTDYFEDM
uniref:Uncharacterized protein n=1 Tax=Brassica oleracea var. oleracea TaxID=109376 RepID=A0A0D3DBQ6_BRAOL